MESGLIGGFLDELRLKGKKPATIKYYRLGLRTFGEYLLAQKAFSFFAATREQVNAYLCALAQRRYHARTLNRKAYIVYAFYQWLKERGLILLNPCGRPCLENHESLPRRVPAPESVAEAYRRLRYSPHVYEQRDYIMLELAYGCGLRRCELHNLNVEDINPDQGTIRVKGKFSKERLVPIGEKCLRELLYYVYYLRPRFLRGRKSHALFLSWRRRKNRLDIGSIDMIFRRIRKVYGIDPSITAHGLRHAFATHLLQSGASLPHISKMLGHAKLNTTQVYTRILGSDLKKQHEKYHPRG